MKSVLTLEALVNSHRDLKNDTIPVPKIFTQNEILLNEYQWSKIHSNFSP